MIEEDKKPTHVKEGLVIGLTLARLLLANTIAERTRAGKSSRTHIGAFVIADIADGVLARRWGVDTPLRRASDGITDRLSTLTMAKAVYDSREDSRVNIGILVAREALVGVANIYHLVRTGEVVQGHGVHKLGSLSTATFGAIATNAQERTSKLVGAGANAVNAILATDYISNAISPHGTEINGVRHIQFDHIRRGTRLD